MVLHRKPRRITRPEISDALLLLLIVLFDVFMITARRPMPYGVYKGYSYDVMRKSMVSNYQGD